MPIIVESYAQRNEEFNKRLDEEFKSDYEKMIAYKVRDILCEMYPTFNNLFRGSILKDKIIS